jgi:hypothetical protein
MRILNQRGEEIGSVEEWFLKAPPKKGALQWQDYRSAKQLAKSWFRLPLASPPHELVQFLQRSFPSQEVHLADAYAEYVVRLDDFKGEQRNADLIVLGGIGSNRVLISIEAKADEPFGDQLVGKYFDSRSAVPRSQVPARIAGLVRAVFNSDLDAEIRRLRYQLIHSAAATLIEAQKRRAGVAVFLVHEFLSRHLRPHKVERNNSDWASFVARLVRDQAALANTDRAIGPIFVAGGGFVPSCIPLYKGKFHSILE